MSITEQLKVARENAGRLVRMARETGLKLTATREKGEATADLDAKFDKESKAATEAVKAVSQLESLADMELSLIHI